jgi:hypothetical protein
MDPDKMKRLAERADKLIKLTTDVLSLDDARLATMQMERQFDVSEFIDDNQGDGTYDKGRHAGLRGTRIAMTRVVAFALV